MGFAFLSTFAIPPATYAVESQVLEVQAETISAETRECVPWEEDFEGISPGPGHLPPGWVDGGGNDEFGVVDTTACEGSQSLYLHGVLGGNWAAVVASPIIPSLTYCEDFTLELRVRNGSESLWGYHPNRAILTMRIGSHWTSTGRGLFAVREDGRLDGPLGPMGPYLELDTCYAMRIRYTRLDALNVRMQYWLDGAPLADVTLPAAAYEDDLVWFMWVSDEGSAWFDDIAFECTSVPDCNGNGVPDDQDIAAGTSDDCDASGVPDECELISDDCPYQVGDVNNDGEVNREDVLQFTLVLLGLDHCGCSVAAADINGDGEVDRRDIRPFRRLLRCTLGYPLRDLDARSSTVRDLTSLADELGVDLDLRTLLQDAVDRERPPSRSP
ncbi:MAG: dockerin type I domain-containing protein [Planctomycetota bacterium]